MGMTADLVQRYTAPQTVWKQADETMVDALDGETLSSFVLRSSLSKDELVEAEHKLKQTEYTQPAMLTADFAIERTLQAYGHEPTWWQGIHLVNMLHSCRQAFLTWTGPSGSSSKRHRDGLG